jgi:hypothetical protein
MLSLPVGRDEDEPMCEYIDKNDDINKDACARETSIRNDPNIINIRIYLCMAHLKPATLPGLGIRDEQGTTTP